MGQARPRWEWERRSGIIIILKAQYKGILWSKLAREKRLDPLMVTLQNSMVWEGWPFSWFRCLIFTTRRKSMVTTSSSGH